MIIAKNCFRKLTVCVSALGLALAWSGVLADPYPPEYITLENPYIGVAIGYDHHHHVSPCGHCWDDDQPVRGRFAVWNILGDPEVPDDDYLTLTFSYSSVPFVPVTIPGDKWGCGMIWIDGAPFEYGATAAVYGEDKDGFWDVWPHIPTNQRLIRSVYYPVSSEDEFNSAPGHMGIRVEHTARLMHDMVRLEWEITNVDSYDHMVGFRVANDFVANRWDDGTYELRNVPLIPGVGIIEYDHVISGSDVPEIFECFNSLTDPVMSIRAIFRGNGATPPDVIGSLYWIIATTPIWTYVLTSPGHVEWAYEPVPFHRNTDVAYGAWWKPVIMRPGQKRKIVHYFGNACATHDFTRPNPDAVQYVATVQGPRALKYYTDDDLTSQLWPEPFKVTGYLGSIDQYIDLHDVQSTLILPPGLELDPGENGRYTKSVDFAAAYDEAIVSWMVRPVGHPTGILDYSVAFSATPVGGTTLRRSINVPATESQPLSRRWQMISVPFELSNPEPETALGLTSEYTMWKYDTYARQYVPVTSLVPGEAYWLWLDAAQTTAMIPGHYTPIGWAGTQGSYIPLQPGWNMIGNPYLYTVTLGELRVYTEQYGSLTMDEAASKGLVYQTMFWYDPIFRRYNWSAKSTTQIKPWQGYWIKARRSGVSLVITPVTQVGASVGGSPPPDGGGGPPPPP